MGTLKARTFKKYNKWHYCLRHINKRKLRYLYKIFNISDALPIKSPIKYKCNAYSTVKIKKNRNYSVLERVKESLDLISIDIYG